MRFVVQIPEDWLVLAFDYRVGRVRPLTLSHHHSLSASPVTILCIWASQAALSFQSILNRSLFVLVAVPQAIAVDTVSGNLHVVTRYGRQPACPPLGTVRPLEYFKTELIVTHLA